MLSLLDTLTQVGNARKLALQRSQGCAINIDAEAHSADALSWLSLDRFEGRSITTLYRQRDREVFRDTVYHGAHAMTVITRSAGWVA
ncbi:hypothetical protein CMV60_23115 [Serratia marcescens]|nr:hypothetical protein CMV60_23115 [Serratia marcescens]